MREIRTEFILISLLVNKFDQIMQRHKTPAYISRVLRQRGSRNAAFSNYNRRKQRKRLARRFGGHEQECNECFCHRVLWFTFGVIRASRKLPSAGQDYSYAASDDPQHGTYGQILIRSFHSGLLPACVEDRPGPTLVFCEPQIRAMNNSARTREEWFISLTVLRDFFSSLIIIAH